MSAEYVVYVRGLWASLFYADTLMRDAKDGKRELTIGDHLFIYQTARDCLNVDYNRRPASIDSILLAMAQAGVFDEQTLETSSDTTIQLYRVLTQIRAQTRR